VSSKFCLKPCASIQRDSFLETIGHSHDNRTNSQSNALEYHRHRSFGCHNRCGGTVLAGNVSQGDALFTHRRLRQRHYRLVSGRADLVDQRDQRISRINSCTFSLAGYAGISALQLCDLRVRGALQRAVPRLSDNAESLPLRDRIQPFVHSLDQIAETYAPHALRKTIAIVFLVLAIQTAAFDVRDDIASIRAGQVPQDVIDANQPVNFVHVLDLGFLLPALCVTAILLFRRKASGYALAPIFLTLLAIMSLELVSILTVMGRAGFGMSYPMITFFVVLGVAFTILLWFYFLPARRTASVGLPSAGRAA
jgi:hypothetical protein